MKVVLLKTPSFLSPIIKKIFERKETSKKHQKSSQRSTKKRGWQNI